MKIIVPVLIIVVIGFVHMVTDVIVQVLRPLFTRIELILQHKIFMRLGLQNFT